MTNTAPQNSSGSEIVTVLAETTRHSGRFVISAGRNHFVSDAKPASGGPGEAVQAGELLLSALASCSLSVVQSHALTLGVPLQSVAVTVSFQRDPDDVTRYAHIVIRFRLIGVDSRIAEALVKQFTDTCPIYNTIRRGGIISVEFDSVVAAV